jgi:multidrug efflux pump subunit AcrB
LIARATKDAVAQVQAAVPLPPGYSLTLGGEAETSSRSFAGLVPAIVISSLGILAVLVLEFGQFRTVLVVFGIVPFGLFGAVVALWLTGHSLSFTAAVGLIALIGIEIKNSILLVDFTEQLRAEGQHIRDAVEHAGELRFLPVLLASVTAIGGLLPLALENNGLFSPLAITLIGGLIASTLLSRIGTPVMYLLLAQRTPKVAT